MGMFRVREDTAKYLRDLDPASSQFFDPKRRTLRTPMEEGGDFVSEKDLEDFTPAWERTL
jgi:hypothetical protein